MIIKILTRGVIAILALLILLLGIGTISSRLSLDRNFTHSNDTQALPFYTPDYVANNSPSIVRISANGYEFRTRIAGTGEGSATVILLHGFPVTSAMWEPLITPLAAAGYRVIAFDQRGYSPGARPEDPAAYALSNLVKDVVAIADAVGAEKFHLVGHDWGAAVGWTTVMQYPDRILSWTGLSIAHPIAFTEALENDPDQQSRSNYFALFSLPWIPETLFTVNGLSLLMSAYSGMLPNQQSEYRAVFSEPGALTAALNWYRQMGAGLAEADSVDPDISTPTLFIWGNNDPTAGRTAVELQENYLKGSYRAIELDADHWLVTSHSNAIAEAILEHLRSI